MNPGHLGASLLLSATLLAGCDGNNLFPTDPVGTGGDRLGAVRGQVTADGAGVPGAVVSLQGGGSDSTDAAGQYRIGALSPGAYRVLLQVPPGFGLAPGDSAARTASVAAGQTVVVNWQLLEAVGAP